MLFNQNFNPYCKFKSHDAFNFAKFSQAVLMYRFAVALLLIFSSSEIMMAAPRDNQNSNDEVIKSQSTDASKTSNEPIGVNMDENIRLRRDLDEYSRAVDPAHVQIEERRRVMHKRLQERFSEADRDNDGAISIEEAYDTMPQLARHFGAVDLNSDHVITLDELEVLQAKIVERQRVTTYKSDIPEMDNSKVKNKPTNSKYSKRAL
jgi:low affinity Fe/Cu permease